MQLRNSQNGFVRGRSYLMNLIEVLEIITKKVDEGQPSP